MGMFCCMKLLHFSIIIRRGEWVLYGTYLYVGAEAFISFLWYAESCKYDPIVTEEFLCSNLKSAVISPKTAFRQYFVL